MANTYTSILVHYIFSTKNREKMITKQLQEKLWPYLGGIARKNKMKALAIGGIEDHVHLLISLPSTLSVAKAIQLIKGASSAWVHDSFTKHSFFKWQEGYGAFSIGVSHVAETIAYINSQKEHHSRRTFKEEYIAFLEKHGVEYDERYIWD